jgi:hypothetical protein
VFCLFFVARVVSVRRLARGRPGRLDGSISSMVTVGPAGGTVSAGGASVVVPAGALSVPMPIAVAVATDAPQLPGNVTLIGHVFAFTPHGQPFDMPVTINVPFTAPATGTPKLYGASADDEVWAPVTGATNANGVLSTQVLHFSWFAPVVGSTSPCAQPSENCQGVPCCQISGFEVGCDGGDFTCKVMLGGPCQRDSDCVGDPQFFGCVGFTCCGKTGAGVCSTSDATDCCSGACNAPMFCQ